MILRTGVDLVEIARFRDALDRRGDRLLKKLFTPQELADCKMNVLSLAARFAAKEAVSKAFGTGIGAVRWQDIEVIREAAGTPALRLHGEAHRLAQTMGLNTWSISLSHTDAYAVAFVVAVGQLAPGSGT